MFIDLNNQLRKHKEGNMFKWENLNNYSTQNLDAKYEQVDTNKFATNQK